MISLKEKSLLIIVDMQNDFIDGSLGFDKARTIIPAITNLISKFQNSNNEIIFTQDTHFKDYLQTTEGQNLPIIHCIKGTRGHEICDDLKPFISHYKVFEKSGFGSLEIGNFIKNSDFKQIFLVGLVSDICVISNAIVAKSALQSGEIYVIKDATQSPNEQMREKTFEILQNLHINCIDLSQIS